MTRRTYRISQQMLHWRNVRPDDVMHEVVKKLHGELGFSPRVKIEVTEDPVSRETLVTAFRPRLTMWELFGDLYDLACNGRTIFMPPFIDDTIFVQDREGRLLLTTSKFIAPVRADATTLSEVGNHKLVVGREFIKTCYPEEWEELAPKLIAAKMRREVLTI